MMRKTFCFWTVETNGSFSLANSAEPKEVLLSFLAYFGIILLPQSAGVASPLKQGWIQPWDDWTVAQSKYFFSLM